MVFSKINTTLNILFINKMCRKVRCSKCKKYTWAGCGRHIEEALKDVPMKQRCQCSR